MRHYRVIAATGAALLLGGCGITAGTQVADSEGAAKASYATVALVPMDGTPDERLAFEGALAVALKARGVATVTSARLGAQVTTVDGAAVIRALKADGANAVLYLWLGSADKAAGGSTSAGNWGWTGAQSAWYTPSGNTGAAIGRFEARLYDLASNQEVWFGRTLTFYPKSPAVDAPQVAQAVVGELAKRGFIAH